MLRYHMSVITRDAALRRSIKRLTTATGATVDFSADGAQVNPTRSINLAIFDARTEPPDRRFFSLLPRAARILYIVSARDLVSRVPLFEDQRVTSLFCHDERFDDDEFISSATKALRGEIFGLQKYFPWGVTTFTMLVKNYEEKTRAVDIMLRYAQLAGVRGPVRDRIQLVADELMMNALYHAPTDANGQEKFRDLTVKQLAQLPEVSPIQVQYGCSGRYFGMAVRDAGGSLRRERALEYLARARAGAEMEQKQSGAGLGLISVLSSVSKLVFNLSPGVSTEVIGLLDMELLASGVVGARSLHIFTTAAAARAEEKDEPDESAAEQVRPRRRLGGWLVAGLLGAALAGVATTYYLDPGGLAALLSGDGPPAPARSPSLTIHPEPSTADITVGGEPVRAGVAVPLLHTRGPVEVRVAQRGYRPWSRTFSPAELTSDREIHVRLDREP
jgi:hypothetical protein